MIVRKKYNLCLDTKYVIYIKLLSYNTIQMKTNVIILIHMNLHLFPLLRIYEPRCALLSGQARHDPDQLSR